MQGPLISRQVSMSIMEATLRHSQRKKEAIRNCIVIDICKSTSALWHVLG